MQTPVCACVPHSTLPLTVKRAILAASVLFPTANVAGESIVTNVLNVRPVWMATVQSTTWRLTVPPVRGAKHATILTANGAGDSNARSVSSVSRMLCLTSAPRSTSTTVQRAKSAKIALIPCVPNARLQCVTTVDSAK